MERRDLIHGRLGKTGAYSKGRHSPLLYWRVLEGEYGVGSRAHWKNAFGPLMGPWPKRALGKKLAHGAPMAVPMGRGYDSVLFGSYGLSPSRTQALWACIIIPIWPLAQNGKSRPSQWMTGLGIKPSPVFGTWGRFCLNMFKQYFEYMHEHFCFGLFGLFSCFA